MAELHRWSSARLENRTENEPFPAAPPASVCNRQIFQHHWTKVAVRAHLYVVNTLISCISLRYDTFSGNYMRRPQSLDALVKRRLRQWPQRPPGVKPGDSGVDAWLRGRPSD